ncbi:putative NAD H dehydrogenase [Rosellinia necatrix]|uniref:Putative NAD H dehydrogenase n=1 Tax=Rosellinia necatrix TaxID=77044 RepID=A0A1S7UI25_ROSNE|nr:putative NAD H dehydrogenase [Rosellinia necatrix]
MKVFVVFAHPEPQSLNGALLRVTVDELTAQGHEVRVSDLYAMRWKSQADRADFPRLPPDARLQVARASGEAYASGGLTDDVEREQEKLRWADAVVFQFPLWWMGMPAILKGWFDRVYAFGFAYGLGEHSDARWGDRYGEGTMLGKRALLVVTAGAWREHFSARGVNGPIDDVLFPITHGMLYYPGFEVLPSFVAYRTDRLGDAGFESTADELRQRLRAIADTKPIAYRPQNGGDYEIPSLTLKPGLEDACAVGFSLHSIKERVSQI